MIERRQDPTVSLWAARPANYLQLKAKLQADLAAWDAQGKPSAPPPKTKQPTKAQTVQKRPARGSLVERVLVALERGQLTGKPDTWTGVTHMSRNVITKSICSLRKNHGYNIRTIKYGGRDFGYQLECF